MDTREQLIDRLADRYRGQGYRVITNPRPDALPPFAKDFRMELLAERPDGNGLVSAKTDKVDFEQDMNQADYADAIGRQRGWRYDVTVLGASPTSPRPMQPAADDLSVGMIQKLLASAEQLFDSDFEAPAIIITWPDVHQWSC